jgi:transcriptional regulator with XRE-family HTH domain
MTEAAKALGEFIAGRRARMGLTQDELAAGCKRSRRQVLNWEAGRSLPHLDLIRAPDGSPGPLSRMLDVKWETLARRRAKAADQNGRRRRGVTGAVVVAASLLALGHVAMRFAHVDEDGSFRAPPHMVHRG